MADMEDQACDCGTIREAYEVSLKEMRKAVDSGDCIVWRAICAYIQFAMWTQIIGEGARAGLPATASFMQTTEAVVTAKARFLNEYIAPISSLLQTSNVYNETVERLTRGGKPH